MQRFRTDNKSCLADPSKSTIDPYAMDMNSEFLVPETQRGEDSGKNSKGALKEIPKEHVEFVVVSYADPKTKVKYVSAVPSHWVDQSVVWYPQQNKSERSTQMVDKDTWRQYPMKTAHWDTLTRDKNEANKVATEIGAREQQNTDGSSTESEADVRQKQPKALAKKFEIPSAPEQATTAKCRLSPGKHKRPSSESNNHKYRELTLAEHTPKKSRQTNERTQCNKTAPCKSVGPWRPTSQLASSTSTVPSENNVPTSSPEPVHLDLGSPHSTSTPNSGNPCPSRKSPDNISDSGEILLMVLEAMNSMQTSLENVVSRLTSVEKILAERSLAASETFTSAGDSTNNWASTSAERLDENQRAMLLQRPMVFNDDQWKELESQLDRSGRHGAFFDVMVKTIADRIVNKTTAHKTANGALRAIFDESYIAERVTMAGYKKGCDDSARDYSCAGRSFVKIGRSEIYWVIYEVVKLACSVPTSDEKIQKAIREGVNTIRLHDKDRRMRERRNRRSELPQDSRSDHNDTVDNREYNNNVEPNEND